MSETYYQLTLQLHGETLKEIEKAAAESGLTIDAWVIESIQMSLDIYAGDEVLE